MNKTALGFLIVLAVFAAGCPHNHYELTLAPRGDVMERDLIFYREDPGSQPANEQRFLAFDSNELAAIAALYPKDIVKNEGNRYTARGEFAGWLPGDIGGSGWFKRLTTSMGTAGFYVERFRGNDDLAAAVEKKFEAADQLADLVVGWSHTQFRREPNYKKLRHFLDQDFRRDLKNLILYLWRADSVYKDDGWADLDGYLSRFGQYLTERDYVGINDAPLLIRGEDALGDSVFHILLQRVIARKLDVAAGQPIPQALAFLADMHALENSFKDYLAGTDAYRAKLRAWEKGKRANAKAEKPEPDIVLDELVTVLFEMDSDGAEDRITVRLSLLSEPLRTNGKWDEVHRQATWDSSLPDRNQTGRLPAFGYADWVEPREDFQKDHLGGVLLTGQNLLSYCLWRTNLNEKQAVAWEQFLAGFRPGPDAMEKLGNFRFAGEPVEIDGKAPKLVSDIGRELIKKAIQAKP